MESKFLSDGRKVAVIGKLNNTEWIVQEIFVSANGDEIPAGESFVAKSLLDAPAESYKQREEKMVLERKKRAEADLERINAKIRDADIRLSAKTAMLANSPELSGLMGEKSRLLAAFMTGKIEYVVQKSWEIEKPKRLEDLICSIKSDYGHTKFDGIKLLSVLGGSKGSLLFNLHRYSDSSGSSTEIYPFETYEQAIEKIREIAAEKISSERLSFKDLLVCQEMGIVFNSETKEKLYAYFKKSLIGNLDNAEKEVLSAIKKRDELKEKLEKIRSVVFAEEL
jgi:hypothetical protein